MDRTWINCRQFSPAYIKGVKGFMQFVRERFDEDVEIRCPCRRCLNQIHRPQVHVEDHMFIYGMSNTYTRWIHHGEPINVVIGDDSEHENETPEYMEHDTHDVIGVNEDEDDDDDGILGLLEDLYTSANHDGNQSMFASVLAEAKRELYPGCANFSRFSFLVKLLHIKSYYRITNIAFSATLKLLSLAFLACTLPQSYNEAKNTLRELGLGYDSIHVCKNNCVLFRKEYASNEDCPVCGVSRWRDPARRNRVPHKVLRHFPLIPRLKRMFVSKRTAEDTQWHKLKRQPIENELSHPADGEAWKDFDRKYPWFARDARNLRLGLSTDGFNPFGNMSSSYSMWPVFVMPYNLPPWACMEQSNCMMALLIPGPKAPGKDFDAFLQPLIEDLLELWKGVRTYDAVTKEMFNLHAAIICCIHDYPALSTLSGRSTRGYYACVHCDKDPCSQALRHKIGYLGHRRFLPRDHPWRKSKAFNGMQENREKPGEFSTEELLEQLEKVKDVRPGKHPQNKKRKRPEKDQPTWSHKVSLFDLPYWSSLKLRHNLDVMHIEKNICDNLLGTFLNIEGKTKDTTNARLDLEDMGIRKELHLKQNGDSYVMPPACYTMSKDQKAAFCEFLRDVKFPDGYASNLARCVNADGCKVQGLKTHDCHILLQRILPVGMRGFMRKDIYEAITELGNFFREMCSRTLKLDVLQRLKKEIPIILCKLEKIFPPAFFDVMVHLAVHLPDEAILRGPVQYGWMYPIERRLCTLKRFVRNSARPEGSIAEAYIADECLTFCSRYMDDMETRFNRESSQQNMMSSDLSVFMHGVNLVGSSRITHLDDEYDKMVWYVLNNCPEVDPYKDLFREELEKEGTHDIDKRLEKGFAKWFKNYIARLHQEKPAEVSDDLHVLSCGPDLRVRIVSSCIVNGVRYHTTKREKQRKTQNSGIMTEGTHKDECIDFYGVLNEIIELQYNSDQQVNRSVVLFRCDWFDLEGKKRGIREDGYFKSINIGGCWYKNDPFILATQSTKVFYLQDTKLGKRWRVVQKFEPRNLYVVTELDTSMEKGPSGNGVAYQEDGSSHTDFTMQDINPLQETLHREDEDGCHLKATLVHNVRNQDDDGLHEGVSESDDDTILQYCSDNEHPIIPMDESDDEV